jgi:hypothetical protein
MKTTSNIGRYMASDKAKVNSHYYKQRFFNHQIIKVLECRLERKGSLKTFSIPRQQLHSTNMKCRLSNHE